jgi:hypothetical protein
MERSLSLLNELLDFVVVEAWTTQGARFDLERRRRGNLRSNLKTDAYALVHDLSEGFARAARFFVRFKTEIIVEGHRCPHDPMLARRTAKIEPGEEHRQQKQETSGVVLVRSSHPRLAIARLSPHVLLLNGG